LEPSKHFRLSFLLTGLRGCRAKVGINPVVRYVVMILRIRDSPMIPTRTAKRLWIFRSFYE